VKLPNFLVKSYALMRLSDETFFASKNYHSPQQIFNIFYS
jgi:hypothetical protein